MARLHMRLNDPEFIATETCSAVILARDALQTSQRRLQKFIGDRMATLVVLDLNLSRSRR